MASINRDVSVWINSANANGLKGTTLALAALEHIVEHGDSTVFAKMCNVENVSYVRNLSRIAAGFGFGVERDKADKAFKLKAAKDGAAPAKGMVLKGDALAALRQAVADGMPLGGSRLAGLFKTDAEVAVEETAKAAKVAKNTAAKADPVAKAEVPPVITPVMALDLVLANVKAGIYDLDTLKALADAVIAAVAAAEPAPEAVAPPVAPPAVAPREVRRSKKLADMGALMVA